MIQASHLSKRYPGAASPALDDVSFTVGRGEVCGLLGRNGAGKSTTLNLLTGCLAPTAGRVTVGGVDLLDDPIAAKRRLGYAPEQPPLYPDMTLLEYLVFAAEAKRLPHAGEEAERVMEETALTRRRGDLLRTLSKGNRQRAGIAQALLGDPPILILDEPSIGLDPEQITKLRALIASLGKDRTVLLSSHILSEITLLCGRILLLSCGRLVADGTPEQVIAQSGKKTLEEAFLALTADTPSEEDDRDDAEDEPPRRRGRKGRRA
ncbi:MAG: ABC transporter ATP-binding protein [Eubacteriales bacterium]|nr:ABC transporter ATP-binding protein [Eubacteriales bacterium]